VGLVPARDITHAAEIARILADPKDSPLRRLLSAAADQTELDRPPAEAAPQGPLPAGARESNVAGSSLGGLRQRVERYFGDEPGAERPRPSPPRPT
jgi:type VI secretion system protein ImpL